jgi:hypothetical protein
MATRATDKPTVRIVRTKYSPGELIAEIREGTVTLRPPRSRKGGESEVVMTWGSIYDRGILIQSEVR